jgi:multidrug efflux pump subunit AcrB
LTNSTKSEGVLNWSSFIGKGPNAYDIGYSQGEANSGYAHLLINTSSGEENQMVIDSLEKYCFNNLPDADVKVNRLGSGGGASTPVEIRISGPNISDLYKIMNSVKLKLRKTPGTKNVDDDWGPKIKKFIVEIDQNKLSRSGLTNQDVAVSLNTSLSGQNVGDFREDGNTIPIIMQSKGSQTISFGNLESITVFGQNSGKSVPLTQIASILPDWQYASILRRDMNRTITVSCALKEGYTAGSITNPIKRWLEAQKSDWGVDYSYEL